jgi:hypothetical protein
MTTATSQKLITIKPYLTWRGLIARNPHGLYTDGTRTGHGQQIRRISRIGQRKKTRIGGTLKGLYANDLELSFQKNLSQKRRFWAIVVQKSDYCTARGKEQPGLG